VVPSGLLGRFAVVLRSLDVERPLSSTLLIQVVRVVLVGYDSSVKPGIIRPSTRVRATRY
jgi:hypothetical protein